MSWASDWKVLILNVPLWPGQSEVLQPSTAGEGSLLAISLRSGRRVWSPNHKTRRMLGRPEGHPSVRDPPHWPLQPPPPSCCECWLSRAHSCPVSRQISWATKKPPSLGGGGVTPSSHLQPQQTTAKTDCPVSSGY